MAREIHEREDLLRDATALVPRIQLRLTRDETPLEVFVGFRSEAVSLYFGDDPVYHFNGARELRRAFVDDRLIKAEKGKLVAWCPDRNEKRTDMLRHDLTTEEQDEFCRNMLAWINWLRTEVQAERYEVVGQVPAEGDALARVQQWLDSQKDVTIARSARVSAFNHPPV